MKLARCPKCKGWSEVEWQDYLPPGGYWWKDSDGCPKCHVYVLVETECEIKDCIGLVVTGGKIIGC